MSYKKFISTYEYGVDMGNIKYGILQNDFVIINNPKDEVELDIIDTLLRKYKKLWLCEIFEDWQKYSIPDYITHLCFDINDEINEPEIMNNLPQSLEFLSIMNYSFNGTLTNLPPNLKHLEIHSYYAFKQSLDFLPIGLETLVLNSCCGSVIINATFPPNLKTLVIKTRKMNGDYMHWSFGSSADDIRRTNLLLRNLPASLEYLYINDEKGAQKGVKEYLPNLKIRYIKN
jgi:hypothetical protein